MIFKKISTIALVGTVFTCLSPGQLVAGTFGPFTYADVGGKITITDCAATGHVIVPATIDGKPVTAIGDSSFNYAQMTGITISNGEVSIGYAAFRYCGKLKNVELPEGLEKIGQNAFDVCTSLESIRIPGTVTQIGHEPFSRCRKFKSAIIGEGATSIPAGTFSSCGALENVVIPSSVTDFGAGSFRGCEKLKTITLPENLQSIGDGALSHTAIVRLVIPKSVKSIGSSAFKWCRSLERVALPENLSEIGDETFSDCAKLSVPVIPGKVKRIGKSAFANCSFSTISIPGSVQIIDDFAFTGCSRLVSALLNGNAPKLGKKVFDATPDFIVFIQKGTKGYTVPKWNGHRISLPRPEIAVTSENVTLTSGGSNAKFGNVLVGDTSTVKRFAIQNVGNLKLTKIGGKIKGGASKDFQIKMVGKNSLAPGKIGYVDVIFSPKQKGRLTSKLEINSNDLDESSFGIELRGIGLAVIK